MLKKVIFIFILCNSKLIAQEIFTQKDSIHGGLRFERTCYDVLRYDLNIVINPDEKSIKGSNEITFKVIENTTKIQIDLFENMQIDSIILDKKKCNFTRKYDAVFIDVTLEKSKESESKQLSFYYTGKPIISRRPPWDGGFVWKKDAQGKPWIGVAVQGTGASLWYPCKDSQTDEPDFGATIKVAVPNGLMNVSNGSFIGSEDLKNGYTRWDWEVKSPINNYDITVNIGNYVLIHDNHKGLDLDYYVLSYNEEKARKHFEEVKPMMDCFQSKFGDYPFKSDGYKLVETPYLGMEHQSAVAYGNQYNKGYMGMDLSGTGIGLLFDYIIIHESGHEWFGNSITSADIADMWIHEGFTCYSESVYVECQYGYEKGQKYVNGLKGNVANDKPILGQYGVNNEGSGDMYYKGALMINTIRHILDNDEKWWSILKKFSEVFRHKIIDTKTVIAFFNTESGIDLTTVFHHYLKYKSIPVLELKREKNKISYRWIAKEENLFLPVTISIKNKKKKIIPSKEWQSIRAKKANWDIITIDDTSAYFLISKIP
jgi:aminopeptidase N